MDDYGTWLIENERWWAEQVTWWRKRVESGEGSKTCLKGLIEAAYMCGAMKERIRERRLYGRR